MNTQEYKKLRKELIAKINLEKDSHTEKMFKLVNELYVLEKANNKKITMREIAIETGLNEQYVYRLIRFNDAPDELKQMVALRKITLFKALRLLRSTTSNPEKEIMRKANYIIKNNLSDHEIDSYIKNDRIETNKLMEEREYHNSYNIYRDISLYSQKLLGSLANGNIDKIPKAKRRKVKLLLKLLKERLEVVIRRMR